MDVYGVIQIVLVPIAAWGLFQIIDFGKSKAQIQEQLKALSNANNQLQENQKEDISELKEMVALQGEVIIRLDKVIAIHEEVNKQKEREIKTNMKRIEKLESKV